MRTKTLLIAAAALALGAATSMAQTYSQNIVGYVNVTAPVGKYIMVCNPLTTGNDVVSNVVKGVAGGTTINMWNGSGYTTLTYKQGPKQWQLAGNVNADNTALAPGIGFFLNEATLTTNITFVGSVVTTAGGGTATNHINLGTTPVGSLIPYGDCVTNIASINLQVGGGSTLTQWDPVAQTYRPTFTYKQGPKVWQQPGNVTTNPVVGVAEGFFISPNVATNWIETLQ